MKRKLYKMRKMFKEKYLNYSARVTAAPIFILGHQKSGTTVIASLLSELTGLSVTLDLIREIRRPTYPKLITHQITIEEFIKNNKIHFSNKIIKEANLTLLYPRLVEHFTDAKFVFILRDPRSVIRSILNRLDLPGNQEQLTTEQWNNLLPGWDIILDARWLGINGRNYIEMLAYRWELFVQIYRSSNNKMILVKYEDFEKNKVKVINDLAVKLDLNSKKDISKKVNIQHQTKGDHSVPWIDFFGTENLQAIEKICSEGMFDFGYTRSMVKH